LLESHSFKAALQQITALAPLIPSLSLAFLLYAFATISASIADIDKLKQENAQLNNFVALFQKQIAELQASIAANF
jgi:septal ring factor EnvC (AmiA/AmiB activator)